MFALRVAVVLLMFLFAISAGFAFIRRLQHLLHQLIELVLIQSRLGAGYLGVDVQGIVAAIDDFGGGTYLKK